MTIADDRRSAVEAAIACFMVFEEHERLRLYRLHLQASVSRISPVALDLAAQGGFGIDQIARRLRVPKGWPWPGGVAPLSCGIGVNWLSLGRKALRRSFVGSDRRFAARLDRDGVLMRGCEDPAGELGFLVSGDELQAVARLGECILHTRRGSCSVLLPRRLPETIQCALIGRPIGDMIGHPVLSGRRYRILSVQDRGTASGSVVVFATATRPLELPWGMELHAELERRA